MSVNGRDIDLATNVELSSFTPSGVIAMKIPQTLIC